MISAFQLLYQNRHSVNNIQTVEEVRTIIRSELLDEFTHPRARVSIQQKYKLALDRISNSTLSVSEQQMMIELYNEEYKKLSTDCKS